MSKDPLRVAAALINQRQFAEAERILEQLRTIQPFNSYVLYNLGLVFWQTNRHAEGIRLWRQAIAADPNHVEALVNLGNALYQTGDLRESLRYTQMAARRQPNEPGILLNLAIVLTNLGEAADALLAIEDALRLDPDSLPLLEQYAQILSEMRKDDQTIEVTRRILDHPKLRQRLKPLIHLVSKCSAQSDWEALDTYLPQLHAAAREPDAFANPMALTFSMDDPALLGTLARRLGQGVQCPAAKPREPRARLTVGYLSPDFREHPVAHMVLDILKHHDRSAFRVVTLATLPMDDSPLCTAISAAADEHIDLTRIDDTAAFHLLRQQEIDILVDLAGSTKWCRMGLMAKHAAPVQVLWLGCPCTTGMPFYDAFILDEEVAPPGYEAHCTEPLVRLPCCYHPISSGLGTPSEGRITRQIFGFPPDALVVGMLQQAGKIRPPFIDDIAKVIARHPTAHLWLRAHSSNHDQIRKRMDELGIPANRLCFAEVFKDRADYLAAMALPDLIIDTFPYGGHSTTGEAMMLGATVLTRRGDSIHSRVASSMMRELGLSDLVANSETDLLAQLERFLSEPGLRQAWKDRFQSARLAHQANGTAKLTRHLEAAFRRLWEADATSAQH